MMKVGLLKELLTYHTLFTKGIFYSMSRYLAACIFSRHFPGVYVVAQCSTLCMQNPLVELS